MKKISTLVIMLSGAVLLAMPVAAQEGEWDTAGFVENATYYRDGPGISKSRNTGQFEFSKDFGRKFGLSDFRVSGTLRGTYDATYDLNEGEFGDDAGGPRSFQNFGSSNAQLIYGGDGLFLTCKIVVSEYNRMFLVESCKN